MASAKGRRVLLVTLLTLWRTLWSAVDLWAGTVRRKKSYGRTKLGRCVQRPYNSANAVHRALADANRLKKLSEFQLGRVSALAIRSASFSRIVLKCAAAAASTG